MLIRIRSLIIGVITMTASAQNLDKIPLPVEYQKVAQLKSDKDRIALAWGAAKDARLPDFEKFRIVLKLTLEMNEKGPFIWEQMKSEPNWDSTMSLYVRVSGIASTDYPFLKPWYGKQHHTELLKTLQNMGYYKADGVTPGKRRFSESDKKKIFDYATTLYLRSVQPAPSSTSSPN
ncbi:hypothetical protein [Mesoterricola silvestris]|uniref:hypothetical protein n=1 Tax=Mesoterricola silvestris TaxID=2927979 RepID=UPI00292FD26C|nr:hypothetical protein [Mesoterricola silvestris]